jgi:hypothetical protein
MRISTLASLEGTNRWESHSTKPWTLYVCQVEVIKGLRMQLQKRDEEIAELKVKPKAPCSENLIKGPRSQTSLPTSSALDPRP